MSARDSAPRPLFCEGIEAIARLTLESSTLDHLDTSGIRVRGSSVADAGYPDTAVFGFIFAIEVNNNAC